MAAYYNEIEPFAAAWLRELMKAGLIADGTVDERPIEQVEPHDLKGFVQCHFFAGIGVWSYALRAAGWPDDSPVWSGSCPCQGFSASGKRGGFSDKRHLWPAWFRLIGECRPHTIFGEQVGGQGGKAWFDTVSADLEGISYAVGAAITGACGFGAPHIRKRLYFVADALQGRRQSGATFTGIGGEVGGQSRTQSQSGDKGYDAAGRLADTEHSHGRPQLGIQREAHGRDGLGRSRAISDLDDSPSPRLQEHELRNDEQRTEQRRKAGDLGHAEQPRLQRHAGYGDNGDESRRIGADEIRPTAPPGLTNGFWANCEWLPCRDGKWRPAESGLFPLAHGAAKRVGRLRGYGNCIVAPQAQGFIEAYSEAMQIEGRAPKES